MQIDGGHVGLAKRVQMDFAAGHITISDDDGFRTGDDIADRSAAEAALFAVHQGAHQALAAAPSPRMFSSLFSSRESRQTKTHGFPAPGH
jgi:hypothetical protein